MSPRSSAEASARTREAIIREAVERGSIDGLEGLTIGKLAGALRMSKAGVIGRFGDKEALQLAALDSAIATFRREVWERAADEPAGIARLQAVGEAWMSYLERDVFPGGCLLTAAAAEFDGRPGRLHDAIKDALDLWGRVLAREASIARDAGDLPDDLAPEQVAFEMNAVAMAVNQARQLQEDGESAERGRAALARLFAP
jgi:AcrR family transcriptional regulator